MRGERELRNLVDVLEDIVAAVSQSGTTDVRLVELAERHREHDVALRERLSADGDWTEEERERLEPWLSSARRLNAIATHDARGRYDHVSADLSKTRRALEVLRSRRTNRSGRSCDVAG